MIEACGVPHPEIDLILVNGAPGRFLLRHRQRRRYRALSSRSTHLHHLRKNDYKSPHSTTFVADGHLGRLARNLRLLGFDVAYDPQADDRQLLRVMERENRALLTRDRRLLMHAVVKTGYYPRSQNADEQTVEVTRRFNLLDSIAPFTRCIRCNGLLRNVSKAEIVERLEPLTNIYYEQFQRCTDCEQIYWPGSHFSKLQERLEKIRLDSNS